MNIALSAARQGCHFARCGVVPFRWQTPSALSDGIFRRHSCAPPPISTIPTKSSPVDDASCYSTRTHTCGALRSEHVGLTVNLKGWVQFDRKRFLILRDAYGSTQVLLDGLGEDMQKVVQSITLESVVEIQGEVISRPENQVKKNLATGEIEVRASYINVLGAAPSQMPLIFKGTKLPTEQLRMRYRYLYLRFPHMQKILRLRSQILHDMRKFLIQKHFVDVETPTLFRKTPGGAQEYIVPTQSPGLFYSLVQSPQQFKQLLMVSGIDRYFQIARCYRDETVNPNRQPEFTQLDIELSYVDRDGVMSLIEDLLEASWPVDMVKPTVPFPRMTYYDAMTDYGSDKPDTRFGSKICDFSHLLNLHGDKSENNLNSSKKLSIKTVLFPGSAAVLRKDQWQELQKDVETEFNSTQLLFIPIKQIKDLKNLSCNILGADELKSIIDKVNPSKGDLLVLCSGPNHDVLKQLGTARIRIADALEESGFSVRDNSSHKFLWIVDFPLFEEDEDGHLQSAHHPFTQPHPDDIHLLYSEPLNVRGLHYDLVLNGSEIGGGSIRISKAELQNHILSDILKLDTSSLQHLLDALSLGCPPHGGIALGFDRLMAIICGVKSIREVIAFPKGLQGKDPMSGAPAPLTIEDAKLYKLPFN